jgi:hypothetical protein
MKTLYIICLVGSIAFATKANAQNANDTSNNANPRQAPTIEDRLAQLEQDQHGLKGQMDALGEKLADLQQEIKKLEGQSSDANDNNSKAAASQIKKTSGVANDDSAKGPSETAGASYDIFYDRLQSDGQWLNEPTYGPVWQPNVASTDQNWRPYTDGRWVYTDRGWTWTSNEKFGWATYHYGRWASLSERGWVWVPGNTWAPAWVSWRESDDYVGWAPLPPEADSEQDMEIEAWADNYYNIGPGAYVFLKTADLANRSYRDFIASPHDDLELVSRTKNVTNIFYGEAGVIDHGPDYDRLVRNSNVKIDRYRLNFIQQSNPEAQFTATTRGDQLEVVAPASRLQRAATVEPKISGNLANAQVDRGWENIDESRAKQLKQTWEKEAPVPASLPAKPVPPKPLLARTAGQSQAAGQRPATDNREPNSSATPQPNQGRNDETMPPTPSPNAQAAQPGQQPPAPNENRRQEPSRRERRETTPPNPSPTPNAKAQSGRQPPTPSENGRQEPHQGKGPETTPPAPSPTENEGSTDQPKRREGPPKENRNQEQRESERTRPAASNAESPASKNERPARSEGQHGEGESVEQKAPSAAGAGGERGGMPQKEETAVRHLKNGDETPAQGDENRHERSQNPSKSNAQETEQPTSGNKKGQGHDQSDDEKAGGKKRSDEPEKKKGGPSEQ